MLETIFFKSLVADWITLMTHIDGSLLPETDSLQVSKHFDIKKNWKKNFLTFKNCKWKFSKCVGSIWVINWGISQFFRFNPSGTSTIICYFYKQKLKKVNQMQKRGHEFRVKFYNKNFDDIFDKSSLPLKPEVHFTSLFD